MPQPPNILSANFINFLQGRPAAPVNFNDAQGWADGAVRTILGAGNPAGARIALDRDIRLEMLQIVGHLISNLDKEVVAGQSTFDQLFFVTLSQLEHVANPDQDTNLFSFGRAQKLISIMLKYCYTWRHAGNELSPAFGNLNWVERWAPFLHVPVDRQTIEHLSQQVGYQHLANSGTMLISWKWHLGKPRYCRIQDAIRFLARHDHVDPLHYEMDMIWIQANNPEIHGADQDEEP